MAKIHTQDLGKFYYHYPAQAVIVGSRARGRDNAMACAWNVALSREPPLYGVAISPKRYTYDLILESGEFTVNFMPLELAHLIAFTGGCSGRDKDKLRDFPLAKEPSLKVKAPVLREAHVSFECLLRQHLTTGDHVLFVGEVVALHVREGLFDAEGVLQVRKARPALYLGADYYVTTAEDSLVHHERTPQR